MKIMAEHEAERFLRKYVPVAKSTLTNNAELAEKIARKYGYPVVLKVISRQMLHKTEGGGVAIVRTSNEIKKKYSNMIAATKKKRIKIEGILVQEYVCGTETIIGIKKDPTFGHVIMFGAGGTLTELIKDVSFRACPITPNDAEDMIRELRTAKLFYGFRGNKININLLKSTLVKISKLPSKKNNIEEMDINPFIINDKVGKVVDARISFS